MTDDPQATSVQIKPAKKARGPLWRLGVSVVPERSGAPLPKTLRRIPFGTPQAARHLALIERDSNPKARLAAALHAQLVEVARAADQGSLM